jgi:hypothetical protein
MTTDPGVMLLLAMDDCERVAAECERRGLATEAIGARIVAGLLMERFEALLKARTYPVEPPWAEYFASGGKPPSSMISTNRKAA